MQKQRSIPEGYYQAYDDGITQIYHKDEPKPIALVFSGKSIRPIFHIRFQDGERRAESNKKTIEANLERARILEKQKIERNKPHTLAVGDIVYCSWGFEQTNVDFYQVIEVKKTQVTLQEIGCKSVEQTGWASDKVVPDAEYKKGEPFTKRANGFNRIKLSSFQTLRPYAGEGALHRSWYA